MNYLAECNIFVKENNTNTLTLKKSIAAIIGIAVLVACGSARQASKSARQEQDAKLVAQKLDARQYTVDINYMIPQAGQSKAVNNYSITVDGENFESWLPYAGRATAVPYGGGKGLTFKDKIDEYKDSGWNGDKREITIKVANDEDTYEYFLTVFDNGSATLNVNARNRDGISYNGNLLL